MKAFAVFVLVFAWLVPCHADTTQTWNVTAQCDPNILIGIGCPVAAVINAVFTTTLESGTWPCPECGTPITGIVPVVTDISGTFDGMAMALVGTTGWMLPGGGLNGLPQDVFFTAGGTTYEVFFSSFTNLTLNCCFGQEELDWSAPDPPGIGVPEPSTLLLLTVPLLLALMRLAQRSLRRVYST